VEERGRGYQVERTLSEYLFERFCDERQIPWKRIPETGARTPDYELFPETAPIVVEVKEITPNAEEIESDRVLHERGWGNAIGHTPGDRIRAKIVSSSGQIKAHARGTHPSILVVFDSRGEIPHLESYSVRVAMYGLEQIHIAVPPPGVGSPYRTGMSYGPKRKMTPQDNTSISAVAAMISIASDTTVMLIYHNSYAKVPLPPALLSPYGIRQFRLGESVPGRTADWEEIK
jgi:hypothetical protein